MAAEGVRVEGPVHMSGPVFAKSGETGRFRHKKSIFLKIFGRPVEIGSLMNQESGKSAVDIYAYDDFRLFLNDRYEAWKLLDPEGSSRGFARKAGFSNPGFLNDVIKGRRTLSPESSKKIIGVFGLEDREADYFTLLIKYSRAKKESLRQELYRKILFRRNRSDFARLNPAQSRYFQDYRYALVYNALMVIDFRGDYDQLSNFLYPPIPPGQLSKCITDLCEFSAPKVSQSGIVTTSQNVTGLSPSTMYYWQVNAYNSSYPNNWSGVWSFATVSSAPPVPLLASPSNNSTNQQLFITLSWNSVANATSYALQVSTAANFSVIFLNQTGLSSLSQNIAGLVASNLYYWRVNSSNTAYSSNWSNVWSFATIADTPWVSVPGTYSTVSQALQNSKYILIDSSITQNISISNLNGVTLAGSSTSITVTGTMTISNSSVTLSSLNLIGLSGADGNSPSPGTLTCPTPGNGGNGSDALDATNSKLWLINSYIQGGQGAYGGVSTDKATPNGMPCACGTSGNGAQGLTAARCTVIVVSTQITGGNAGMQPDMLCPTISTGSAGFGVIATLYSVIEIQNANIGTISLDGSSVLISVPTTAITSRFIRPKSADLQVRFLTSGGIELNRPAAFTVSLFSLSGRLVFSKSALGNGCTFSKLNRGVYLVTVAADNKLFRGKFINVR